VIVRVSEALVVSGMLDEFLVALRELVEGFPAANPGLISHEVLVDLEHGDRVQYVSRWRGVDDLIAYAGPGWEHDAVTFPGERRFLQQPLSLRHFEAS